MHALLHVHFPGFVVDVVRAVLRALAPYMRLSCGWVAAVLRPLRVLFEAEMLVRGALMSEIVLD